MLDENLPTFFTRPSSDASLSNVLYFTQNGSEPAPEYSFRRPDPSRPESKNKFAVALADAYNQDVIFAEVLIEPEWQQPTLSAAEIRAQNGVQPPPVPLIPDGFTIQLYNPEQQVHVRGEKSTWTGKESWEFEMPQQSFRLPSASQIDRQQDNPGANALTPKTCFRWKRDSKLSKDMTCFLTGTSLAGKKSKDPDITIALYKQGRKPGLTVYEPNLQRVDVEDRKGLEVVLLLSAEVIREIYLFANRDSFNLTGTPPARRKNSRPLPTSSPKPRSSSNPMHMHSMSGGLNSGPSGQTASPAPQDRRQAEVDAETRRLQAMVQQEEREREKRDQAEQQRIKAMLEEEEQKERQRRAAAVDAETERLRREFGVQGQDFGPKPSLPPRNATTAGPSSSQLQPPGLANGVPPRPVSAGPSNEHAGPSCRWHPGSSPQPQGGPGRRRGDSADSGTKPPKKRSMFF